MGVGDRHSKRVAGAGKAKASDSIQRSYVIDDRELDDPFSAWDDDDAGAQKPEPLHHTQTTTTSVAQTRVERRGAVALTPSPKRALAPPPVIADGSSRRATPLSDALLDPVAMRDIVISRARTLDDPMTTRVLAEIARGEAMNNRPTYSQRAPAPDDAATIAPARRAARSPDTITTESPDQPSRNTRDDISMPRRRTARRAIARDEPFRKK
jgi:hypothetical protein